MDIFKYLNNFYIYLEKVRGYSPLTIKTYKIALELLKDNCQIEHRDGKTILNIMALRIKLKEHSNRSISTKLSAIRSYVKYLKNYHKIDIKLKANQSIKVPKTLPKPIDEDKILQVLQNADLESKILIKTLYGLGLRISELSNLKLENISKGWIRVIGKGNKTRQIPMLESLYNEIVEYIKIKKPQVYLFEKNQKPLNDAQLRYKINKIFANIGIKATPHQLRHAFASHLLNRGARISDVSELLGHSSMATTQIYTKLTDKTKLENYLKSHPLEKDNW